MVNLEILVRVIVVKIFMFIIIILMLMPAGFLNLKQKYLMTIQLYRANREYKDKVIFQMTRIKMKKKVQTKRERMGSRKGKVTKSQRR